MIQKATLYICLATLICLAASCSDEVENLIEVQGDTVFDTITVRSNARILSYKVENAPTEIYSAINEESKEIIVYLPHYYTLGFIDPIIELPEEASITPDGEELVPVFAEEPFFYTVSAPEEEDVIYMVNPIVQQPEIILDELSTAQDTTVFRINGILTVTGQNFIPLVGTGHLIDEAGDELQLNNINVNNDRSFTVGYSLGNREELIAGGPFWFEMRAYALTARMKYPIRFEEP